MGCVSLTTRGAEVTKGEWGLGTMRCEEFCIEGEPSKSGWGRWLALACGRGLKHRATKKPDARGIGLGLKRVW